MSSLKLAAAIKEVRIHLCPHTKSSKGVREFIHKHYVNIKKNHPSLPILIRECSFITPKLWVRLPFGREVSIDLSNLKNDQILSNLIKISEKTEKISEKTEKICGS